MNNSFSYRHRGQLSRVRSTLIAQFAFQNAAASRQWALARWKTATHRVQHELLGEVRRAELHRARLERRAVQQRYRKLLLRVRVSRLTLNALAGALVHWATVIHRESSRWNIASRRQRSLERSALRRALSRWVAVRVDCVQREAAIARAVSAFVRNSTRSGRRIAFAIWRDTVPSSAHISVMRTTLGAALARRVLRKRRATSLASAFCHWRARASIVASLVVTNHSIHARRLRRAWAHWVLQVDVIRELERLELSVSQLAAGRGSSPFVRRSLLR